jgi:hypothetical protein
MAWFTYECKTHGQFKLSLQKREKEHPCPTCGDIAKPVIKAGSVSVVERLDNGSMARSVERLHNIEEIMSDRSDKHSIPDEE